MSVALALSLALLAPAQRSPLDRTLDELRAAREAGTLRTLYRQYREISRHKSTEGSVYAVVMGLLMLDYGWVHGFERDVFPTRDLLTSALKRYPASARLHAARAEFEYAFDAEFCDPGEVSTSWAKVTYIPNVGRAPTRSVVITGKSPEGMKIVRESAVRARRLAPKDLEIWLTSGIVEPDARTAYGYFCRAVELGGMNDSSALPLAICLFRNGEAREDEVVVTKYGTWIKRYAAEHPNSLRIKQLRHLRRFPE